MKSTPLGELCSYLNGGTPKKSESEFWNGEFPWITSSEIQEGRILPARSTITNLGIEKSATKLVGADQLLLVTRTGVGKLAFTSEPVCFSQDITAVIPDQEKLQKEYLAWFLKSQGRYFEQNSRGATIKGITRDALNRLQIPLPPLAEQKRIAEILDAADALRARRREALAQLDTLLQSTFLDMFGDPVSNPMGWEVKSLDEAGVKTKVGPFGSLLHKSDYIAGGIPLVNPKHMNSGMIEHASDETVSESKAQQLSDYRLQSGDLLMARRGEMGRCAIVHDVHDGWLCGTGSFFIRSPKNIYLSEFLETTLSSQPMRIHLENLSGGAIMPSLSGTQIKSLRLPLPPVKRQRKFTTVIKAIRQQIDKQKQHLKELDTLFASLQSRAFGGEL